MKINFLTKSVLFIATLFCVSCTDGFSGREGRLEACADSFATHYFNYQFEAARRFCTPESEQWLKYAASNVHQADVDVLKTLSEGAGIEIERISIDDGDSTATVYISVSNFLCMDTIGTQGHMMRHARFVLPAIYADRQWKIRMEGLPRSERQSRD
ncbi:MAG: hypothetical protein J5506_10020 [Prevotella sp.]|nr:hypothetical protein [Prevotella sp.]